MPQLFKFAKLIYLAARDTIMHDGIEHAGYMAFLTLLSFFPFLVFFVAVASCIGEYALGQKFAEVILNSLPEHVVILIEPRLKEITSTPPQSLLTLAILGAVWTSSSSVEGLRTILNRAYRVKTPPSYVLRRILSIIQFLLITGILTITMFILVFVPVLLKKLSIETINFPFFKHTNFFSIFMTLCLAMTGIYYLIPNIKTPLYKHIPGAILAAILWITSAICLSAYVKSFEQVNLIYGSIASVIVTLIFFYIIHIILIFGAEFNYQLQK